MELTDKVALVTGAASGLGLATSQALLAAGARVLAVEVDEGRLQQQFGELSNRARHRVVDVSDDLAVQAAVAEATDAWGALHIAVNCAGILGPSKTLSKGQTFPPKLWNRVIGINHQEKSFRDTVGILVAYYRGFAESAEPLTGKGDLYTQIALSKQGVCRHRAFAFVVSALAVGTPARLVTNEAHAWVEVDDGRGSHRIDLGGAAIDVDDQTADITQQPISIRPTLFLKNILLKHSLVWTV